MDKILTIENFFARVCSECGSGMNEGYCVGGGNEYYCDDKCLHLNITKEEWDEEFNDEDSDSYWTEWDVDEEFGEYLDNPEEYTEVHLSCLVKEVVEEAGYKIYYIMFANGLASETTIHHSNNKYKLLEMFNKELQLELDEYELTLEQLKEQEEEFEDDFIFDLDREDFKSFYVIGSQVTNEDNYVEFGEVKLNQK